MENYTLNGICNYKFKNQLLLIIKSKGNCRNNCYECPLINSCYDVSYGNTGNEYTDLRTKRFELAKKRFLELFPYEKEALMEILL